MYTYLPSQRIFREKLQKSITITGTCLMMLVQFVKGTVAGYLLLRHIIFML